MKNVFILISHIAALLLSTAAQRSDDPNAANKNNQGGVNANANANANFWATDGVAAQGIIGIVIITVIMFLFLLWINSLFKNRQSIFYILVFTGEIFSLLNVSFFTTLLSSGLLFLVFILKFFDFDKELSRYKKNTYEKTVDTDLI